MASSTATDEWPKPDGGTVPEAYYAVTSTWPRNLYLPSQVLENEGHAAKKERTTLFDLMLRAGTATFNVMRDVHAPKSIVVFAGPGNNAGDGYVVGWRAQQAQLNVCVVQVTDPAKVKGDAAKARKLFEEVGGKTYSLKDDEKAVEAALAGADVIVDALLGGGARGNVRDNLVPVIETMNRNPAPVVAIDNPSGLSLSTGAVLGISVKAATTVTYVACKQGLLTGKAIDYVGKLYYADLGVGATFAEMVVPSSQRRGLEHYTDGILSPRSRSAHKGHFGKVVVAGGDRGMPGAIRLAGEAAQRTGAGLVRVVTHPDNLVAVLLGRPELMVTGWRQGDHKTATEQADWATVMVLGPGLGQTEWSRTLFDAMAGADGHMVLDADGLNLLAGTDLRSDNWVLTPHPGEASRLLKISTKEVEADRFAAARAIQSRFGGVCLLKGAGTLVCDDSNCFVLNVGNPGMATGGMGDTLCGIIAGLLAQGASPLDAAVLGATIHGQAADLAAQVGGERGLLASDLMPYIRMLVNPAQRF